MTVSCNETEICVLRRFHQVKLILECLRVEKASLWAFRQSKFVLDEATYGTLRSLRNGSGMSTYGYSHHRSFASLGPPAPS